MTRTWKHGLLTIPSIGVALLPKLTCPMCWPLYAGILSSLGLGFLISTAYLFSLTVALLILTVGILAFRGNQRRGYRPFLLGLVASAVVLIGKFHLESRPLMYGGVAFLVIACVWNAWPRRANHPVPCPACTPEGTVQINGVQEGRS